MFGSSDHFGRKNPVKQRSESKLINICHQLTRISFGSSVATPNQETNPVFAALDPPIASKINFDFTASAAEPKPNSLFSGQLADKAKSKSDTQTNHKMCKRRRLESATPEVMATQSSADLFSFGQNQNQRTDVTFGPTSSSQLSSSVLPKLFPQIPFDVRFSVPPTDLDNWYRRHWTASSTSMIGCEPKGSAVRFHPEVGTDVMVKNNVSRAVNTRFQCISLMREYSNKSLEEIRFQDYEDQRKGPQELTTRTDPTSNTQLNSDLNSFSRLFPSNPNRSSSLAIDNQIKDKSREVVSKDSPKCKICFEAEIQVAFIPCHHVTACQTCAKKVKRCPVCRKRIESSLRIFLS